MATPQGVQHIPLEAPKDMSAVIESARNEVAQEFHLSQRLDSKMQYQLTVTGAWFAATQAFAVALLNGGGVSRGWIIAVVVVSASAALAFADAVSKSFTVWKLRPDKGLDPGDLKTWADRVHQRDPQVPGEIAKHYAVLLEQRRVNNATRSDALLKSFQACGFAAALAGIELLLVLGVKLIASI